MRRHPRSGRAALALNAGRARERGGGAQKGLRVGYNRATRMIEVMEVESIVGPVTGPKR
jgi:DNA segregation ATPase FtsK/SpoIIIE-like protein